MGRIQVHTRRFIGGLSALHVFFTSQNTTTYEHFRARYNAQGNPYDVGLLSNWSQVFCTPMAPRLPEKLPGRVRSPSCFSRPSPLPQELFYPTFQETLEI